MKATRLLFSFGFCAIALTASAQEIRDGKLYDPGITMTAPAEGSAPELYKVAFLIGQWDVRVRRQTREGIAEATGKAVFSYMNRGHGIMLRMSVPGMYGEDGDSHSIAFLSYQNAQRSWLFGFYDSFREAIRLYNGNFDGKALVLGTAIRAYGSTLVYSHRLRIESTGSESVKLAFDSKNNRDQQWSSTITLELTRLKPSADFMPVRDDLGLPSPHRATEAAQFDFLIGERPAHNLLSRPDGSKNEYDATATAVYVCDGNAILEFMWHDTDPSLPDAATSILRAYNRATRRWECLYTSNRGNGQLYFGGVKEGDRIVLHPFDTDATQPMSMWVFHDLREGAYDWFGQSSSDRGVTWRKVWIINVGENE